MDLTGDVLLPGEAVVPPQGVGPGLLLQGNVPLFIHADDEHRGTHGGTLRQPAVLQVHVSRQHHLAQVLRQQPVADVPHGVVGAVNTEAGGTPQVTDVPVHEGGAVVGALIFRRLVVHQLPGHGLHGSVQRVGKAFDLPICHREDTLCQPSGAVGPLNGQLNGIPPAGAAGNSDGNIVGVPVGQVIAVIFREIDPHTAKASGNVVKAQPCVLPEKVVGGPGSDRHNGTVRIAAHSLQHRLPLPICHLMVYPGAVVEHLAHRQAGSIGVHTGHKAVVGSVAELFLPRRQLLVAEGFPRHRRGHPYGAAHCRHQQQNAGQGHAAPTPGAAAQDVPEPPLHDLRPAVEVGGESGPGQAF